MANEIRRRQNFASGTIDDNPLSNSATTLTSTELAGLNAITSTEYAVLVLDPEGAGNGPEIVYVTAHTGSATTATIVRGREGTSGVQHTSVRTWVHVATKSDFQDSVTSSTRPSTGGLPYEGQLIYETDTKKSYRYNGTTWIPVENLGAWDTYTPTLTQSGAVTKTVTRAAYTQIGKTVICNVLLIVTGTGSAGSQITVSLPVTASTSNQDLIVGTAEMWDNSAQVYTGLARLVSTTTVNFVRTDQAPTGNFGQDPNMALASPDYLSFMITYEAA